MHINYLLTESKGCTGKYENEVSLYWPSDTERPRGFIFPRAQTVEVSKFFIKLKKEVRSRESKAHKIAGFRLRKHYKMCLLYFQVTASKTSFKRGFLVTIFRIFCFFFFALILLNNL